MNPLKLYLEHPNKILNSSLEGLFQVIPLQSSTASLSHTGCPEAEYVTNIADQTVIAVL